ncbi:MAG: choice-of-anchor D domain-containing protein, partial [Acidimicrobiales bacterium]
SNQAQFGAAINSGFNAGSGTVIVSNSTFTSNKSAQDGGAIDNSDFSGTANLTVNNSTFTSNTATKYSGGAIDSADDTGGGAVTVTDSTFSSNSAGQSGGAIGSGDYNGAGTVTVVHSTFSGNTAGTGAAIDAGSHAGGGTVNVAADIFGGSCHQAAGTWNDGGYNVGTDSSCFNSGTGDNATMLTSQLGSLASNGGPTQTIEPLAGNPAIALIPNPTTVTLGTLCPTVDQRGVPSLPAPTKCNSGALQPDPAVTFTADSPPSSASLCSAYGPYNFTATSVLPLTFVVSSGSLPSGLTLSSAGVLSGLPNLTGTYTFQVTASDPAYGTTPFATTPTLSITVAGACTSGTPTQAGTVFLNPSGLSFGAVKVGSMSAYQTFTLTNFNFSSSLVVSSLVLVAPFHISSTTCGGSLGPLQSCFVVIYFAPTTTGAISAGLDIFDNAGSSPQVVVVSGTGF